MRGNKLFIAAIVLAAVIVVNIGCMQRQGGIRGGMPLQKKLSSNNVLFEDERVEVYRGVGETRVLSKETGQEIKVSPTRVVKSIRNKPAAAPPLVGLNIAEGIKLINNDEIHVIETKPDFKHLHSFPNPGTGEDKIIINKSNNTLYFYRGGELYKTYPVATGKKPQYTPEGSFKIANKVEDLGGELKEQLGICWMGLSVPCENDNRADFDNRAPLGKKYGIHGTNEPDSIGRYASGGCIRMSNEQAVELFALVNVGTPVEIR